ncbi:MAG: hypothetical protein MUE85_21960 [Microscillaceae bacterium]|nr:hypothetical protein [Microscillaceae bacterium]
MDSRPCLCPHAVACVFTSDHAVACVFTSDHAVACVFTSDYCKCAKGTRDCNFGVFDY